MKQKKTKVMHIFQDESVKESLENIIIPPSKVEELLKIINKDRIITTFLN